jgi:penicillin-binding protein 1A
MRAWVGSRDFQRDQFDHVAQAERQPGSTFKPIVYGAALEMGFSPDRSYIDGPVTVSLGNGQVWQPTDMHGATNQPMSLRDGLVYSKNTITAQVAQDVGLQRIVDLARTMGVTDSKLDPVPSLALGTSPVTLLEMVDTYGTIAAQGTRHAPLLITRISDAHGRVLAEFLPQPSQALSAATAVQLIDMLRGVVNRGTGTVVKTRFGIVADIAGKTGTTQNNTDGWFILMHPGLVAGAWVGFNDARVTMRSDYWGQGGHNAILLVGDFFRTALSRRLLASDASFPQAERRAPLEAQGASWPAEDWAGAGSAPEEAEAASAPDGGPVVVRNEGGKVLIGDEAGLAAMRREAGPPKSAEEIERAVSAIQQREPAASTPTARLPVAVDPRSGVLVPRPIAAPAPPSPPPAEAEAPAASAP